MTFVDEPSGIEKNFIVVAPALMIRCIVRLTTSQPAKLDDEHLRYAVRNFYLVFTC